MSGLFNFTGRLVLCVLAGSFSLGLVHVSASTVTILNFPGSQSTVAGGINNDRTIVGYYSDAQGAHGFSLHDGVYRKLDVPGAANTFLFDINNNGTIVGSYDDTSGFRHGLLIQNGQYLTLDVPDATWIQPQGISDLGKIAGYHGDSSGKVGGFIYDGSFTSLNFSGINTTAPFKINNSGRLVGQLFSNNGVRGFTYDGTSWQYFTPPGIPSTTLFCEALGINNFGDVVGSFSTGGRFVPYFWDSDSDVTTFLPLPDEVSARPADVNDRGDVVGHGSSESFLVTSVPEPALPVLIVAGLAIFGLHRRIVSKSFDTSGTGGGGKLREVGCLLSWRKGSNQIQDRLRLDGPEPSSAADESQPSSTDTNRASGAAGSRR